MNLGEQQEIRARIQNPANLTYSSRTVRVSSLNPPTDKLCGAKRSQVEIRAGGSLATWWAGASLQHSIQLRSSRSVRLYDQNAP